LTGRATLELGQKAKKEKQKRKKWVMETTNGDQRKREKENEKRREKKRNELANWGRFDGDRPRETPQERYLVLIRRCVINHDGDLPKIQLGRGEAKAVHGARNLWPVTFNLLIAAGGPLGR
jgi:hypothetical protein